MFSIDLPFAANTLGSNTTTLFFNRINTLHPGLGISEATHYVRAIKQMPTRYKPDQSIAVIGSRTDPTYQKLFRYERHPITRYVSNPMFTVEEVLIVQGLDEKGLIDFLSTKLNLNFNNADFIIRSAGVVYTGGLVRPNWRILPAPNSPFWYSDRIIWLHSGDPYVEPPDETDGGTVDPDLPLQCVIQTYPNISIVHTWEAPFTNPYVAPFPTAAEIFTDFYIKTDNIFGAEGTYYWSSLYVNSLVDYTANPDQQALLEPHVAQYTDPEFIIENDSGNTEQFHLSYGSTDGEMRIYNDLRRSDLIGRECMRLGIDFWRDWGSTLSTPVYFESVSPKITDAAQRFIDMTSRNPYMIETGFRPSTDIPTGSTWVDNMGLPGEAVIWITADSYQSSFETGVNAFCGAIKRGAFCKRVADIDIADVRCGALYRDGVGYVILNGQVVLTREVAYSRHLYIGCNFIFWTSGSNGTTVWLGIDGMIQALAEGSINYPFQNIKAICTDAEIGVGEESITYPIITNGVYGTKTINASGGTSTQWNSGNTPSPTLDFSLADTVFYSVNDSIGLTENDIVGTGLQMNIDFGNELMVSQVITP